jgi:predicted transcriptional regulator
MIPEMIIDLLKEHGPMTITTMSQKTAREASNLYAALKKLEIEKKVTRDPATRIFSLLGEGRSAYAVEQAAIAEEDEIETVIQALRKQQKMKKKIELAKTHIQRALEALLGDNDQEN